MKRKFKIFLYLFIFFSFLINFQSKSFADENLDKIKDKRYACNLFYETILKSDNLRVKNFYSSSSGNDFGFNPVWEWDIDSRKWLIKSDGKSIINGYNYNLNTSKLLKPGTKILKIEGIDAAKVFVDWNAFSDFTKDKDLLKLEIIDGNDEIKIIELKKEYNSYGTIKHFLNDIKITDIDIKKSTFTTRVSNVYQYNFYPLKKKNHPIIKIAEDTLTFKKKEGGYYHHACKPDDKYFDEGVLQNPADVFYPDVIYNDKDLETIKNSIWIYFKKSGDFEDQVNFERIFSNNFIVMNKFNLKSFPFDRQVLSFKIVDNLWGIDKRIIEPRGYTDIVLKDFLEKDDIPGWKKVSASIENFEQKKVSFQGALWSGLEIKLELERKHGYYIFKVIFPIILILMVCWSVVWVDPKELEARLTITIVCLLSLIAYNFVIDSELPKLEYLTVLDWIVLISYVYATVPNFLSIISFRLQKTNPKMSDKLEQISKRYGLSSYVLSIFLIVLLNANINPENSSSLISWMAGK